MQEPPCLISFVVVIFVGLNKLVGKRHAIKKDTYMNYQPYWYATARHGIRVKGLTRWFKHIKIKKQLLWSSFCTNVVKNNKVPLNSTRLDESHQRISYTDTETGISLLYMPSLLNLVEIWENLRFKLILMQNQTHYQSLPYCEEFSSIQFVRST